MRRYCEAKTARRPRQPARVHAAMQSKHAIEHRHHSPAARPVFIASCASIPAGTASPQPTARVASTLLGQRGRTFTVLAVLRMERELAVAVQLDGQLEGPHRSLGGLYLVRNDGLHADVSLLFHPLREERDAAGTRTRREDSAEAGYGGKGRLYL